MLSQQGLCCGSPGADRSTSCGRPQVYLRGWRMASRRRRSRRRRRRRKRRKRNSNASVLAVLIDWQLFAGALLDSPSAVRVHFACPFCNGTVASNVRTGQIDHRTVCGNQFCVKEGTVSTQTRQHPHTCPACQTVVWSSQLFGRVRCQHNTPAGKPCPKNTWQVQERKHETKK